MPNMYGRSWRGGVRKVKKSDRYSKGFVPVKKGHIVTLEIEDLSEKGEGVGKIGKFAVFVPGTRPGERVTVKITEIKKNCAVGKRLSG